MREVSQVASLTVVAAVVCWVGERVAPDDGRGTVGGVLRVVDEVDFAQEALLVVLELAHHLEVRWCCVVSELVVVAEVRES